MDTLGLSQHRHAKLVIAFLGALFFVMVMAFSVSAGEDQGLYVEDGIALAGYDPVAYHTLENAVKGNDQYTVEWQGVVWHFVNQEHADLFAAEPEKYQPRFGGFCAYGVAKGYRMKPDMTAWEIHDGELFLYFNQETVDVWGEDREGNTVKADAKWTPVSEEATGDAEK